MDNIVDLGSWIVPNSWDKVTLKMYQEIEKLFSETSESFDVRKCLHILTNHSEDEINMLPVEFMEDIMSNLSFLQEPIKEQEPSNKVEISGETYFINIMEKLKFGEYVSADSVLKNDSHNYAALMAILCRKDGEVYDSKYEAEVFDDRMKMWEEQPITKILPVVNFFLSLYVQSEIPSKLYTMAEEALNLTAQSINNSPKIGVSRRLYLKWQVTKLRKLLKSSKNTSQMRSHSLPTSLRKGKWKKRKMHGKK